MNIDWEGGFSNESARQAKVNRFGKALRVPTTTHVFLRRTSISASLPSESSSLVDAPLGAVSSDCGRLREGQLWQERRRWVGRQDARGKHVAPLQLASLAEGAPGHEVCRVSPHEARRVW
jgi:hypothetical protein